jgi:hypothetical protein
MKFPMLACGPKGFTWLFKSENETKRMCIGFVGIFRRYQPTLQFFDSDSTAWRLASIRPLQPIPFWQRIFGSLREVDVSMEFAEPHSYTVDDFRRALRQAVDADDDVLTQYESRDIIIQKLEKVRTVPEVFQLYRWMRKDFKKVV